MNEKEQKKVLEAIKSGEVVQKGHARFVLYSTLAIVGVVGATFALLFFLSFAIFVLQHGPLPWLIIFLVLVLFVILESLLRRYKFAYSRPALLGLVVLITLLLVFSFALEETHVHERIESYTQSHRLPPGGWFYRHYRGRMPRSEIFILRKV